MNAENWLNQVRMLDELINAKTAESVRLKAMATDITAKPMDGMPFDNTGTVSRKMENAVINLIELAQEIDKLVDKYTKIKNNVVSALEKLPAKEYGVLHRHYIQYMTFEQIAEDMHYSRQQIWRIKTNGLQILEDVIVCYIDKC